nr:sigma-70 family RNA polymerase sigma factor [Nocardioides sp. zg-DK7169]
MGHTGAHHTAGRTADGRVRGVRRGGDATAARARARPHRQPARRLGPGAGLVRVGTRWRRLAEQNPGGYARTTLVRLRVDRARRLRRELLPGLLPERAAPVVITEELDPWLLAALGRLSPHQRAAVVLRVLEDLDHAEIAARLGCSVGTARSHLSRGLARLREAAGERVEVE